MRDACRAELYALLEQNYELMSKYNYRQLHFHLPNNTSFLRMHSPAKYGDSLSGVRVTVEVVNRLMKPITAFEEGRIYNGYRFVYPLFDDGIHCGSVELSFSMSAYLDVLSSHDDGDYFFGVRRDIVESTVFDEDKVRYDDSPISPRLMSDNEIIASDEKVAIFDVTGPQIEALLDTGQNFGFETQYDGKAKLVLINHIRNLEGKAVACIVAITNDLSLIHIRSEKRIIEALSVSIGLLLIVIILAVLRERDMLKLRATTDPLTGLCNRNSTRAMLKRELSRNERYGHPLSVLMLDLDDFKHVNDSFGHAEGDMVLKKFSTLLLETVRQEDSVGRWGGEEFIIVLLETAHEEALLVAEKIRTAVASAILCSKRQITVSIGVASLVTADSIDSLVSRADEALYEAKDSGKNCVASSVC
ncbi:hypothetical protein MASR2M48_25080 [Spirochaetota bacterium]